MYRCAIVQGLDMMYVLFAVSIVFSLITYVGYGSRMWVCVQKNPIVRLLQALQLLNCMTMVCHWMISLKVAIIQLPAASPATVPLFESWCIA